MKNITAIIQARMGSKRLYSKVLKSISDMPMLAHILSRVKCAHRINKIVVATTAEAADNAIEKFCQENGVLCFRGSSSNVLKRYYDAADEFGGQAIVRLTGDNPLVEPQLIDACVDKLIKENLDYISVSGCPLGCGAEVFRFTALEEAFFSAKEIYQEEHVTPYIYDNPALFKIGQYEVEPKFAAPDLRLTVDEREDMLLMNHLYSKFYKAGEIVSLPDVITYLKENPKISNINSEIKQKHYKEFEKNE